jgi:glutamine amidotransferase
MKERIVIIDYGMGNLRSVAKALERLGIQAQITSDKSAIENAVKLILPGVGHFAYAMDKLKQLDLIPLLDNKILDQKTPILGICLGMQLMTSFSEEGNVEGLNWIPAKTLRFPIEFSQRKIKVPHIGWNTTLKNQSHPLTENISSEDLFYFVHSYYVKTADRINSLFESTYGLTFDSGITQGNIMGVQFHPEKSHKSGP